MNQEQQVKVLEALAVVLDMAGQDMSEPAMEMIVDELASFDFVEVKKAIRRCARECKYKITLAEIIERIDDGRPSPEKAWSEVQHLTEDDAKVLTVEQNAAFCMVSTSLIDGDTSAKVAARQTFLQQYEKLCKESRERGEPVQYFLSRANNDRDSTKALEAVTLAISENKLPKPEAVKLLPQHKAEILETPMLEHEKEIAGMVENMANKFSMKRAIGDD